MQKAKGQLCLRYPDMDIYILRRGGPGRPDAYNDCYQLIKMRLTTEWRSYPYVRHRLCRLVLFIAACMESAKGSAAYSEQGWETKYYLITAMVCWHI